MSPSRSPSRARPDPPLARRPLVALLIAIANAASPACERRAAEGATTGPDAASAVSRAADAQPAVDAPRVLDVGGAPSAEAPQTSRRTLATDDASAGEGGHDPGVASPALDGCPKEMARVDQFCIDRWEAHLTSMGPDGHASMHPHQLRPEPGVKYVARSAKGVYPQAYVSRIEARAACESGGKRLCSVAEWYRTCQGPQRWKWPYGPTESRGACNTGKAHLLGLRHGEDPSRWRYDAHFNDPALDLEPGFLARTGEYEKCRSGEWAWDMVGNLHEWVSDSVDPSLGSRIPLSDYVKGRVESRGGNAIILGGFYSTSRELGDGCSFATTAHPESYHDYSTGFRCCAEPAASP